MADRQNIKREARSLLVLGLPLIGSQVAQFAVHTTDTLMLGWYSVTALAQVTLGAQVYFIAFVLGSGIAYAVLPMVAKYAMEDDWTNVRRVTRMGLWMSVVVTAVFMIPMWWSKPILLWMGQDPVVADGGQTYLRIAGWGLLPFMWGQVLRSYLSALEHTGIVLWVAIATLITNALVNYALIFGYWGAPELGLAGAAIASLSTAILSLIGFVIYIQYHFSDQQMFARIWRADWDAIKSVFKLALPISATALAESGLFAASALMMGVLGRLELAAHGVVLQLAALTFMIHMGLAQAGTVRAGQALARNNRAALDLTSGVSMGLSAMTSVVVIAIFLTCAPFLIGLFLDKSDPEAADILRIGVWLLVLAAAFQFVDGAQVMALSILRGLQDTAMPMVWATVSYWIIGMPVGIYLGLYTDLAETGIWIGLIVGLTLAAITLWGRYVQMRLKVGP